MPGFRYNNQDPESGVGRCSWRNQREVFVKPVILVVASVVALLAETATAGPKPKSLVCHVGSTEGPSGETYLDDPACVPAFENGYFCPDAGKVDLIVVASAQKHLNSPGHAYGGLSDYEPGDVGAAGDSTEDGNGNGIDDGCEPQQDCPCWAEQELLAVTAENETDDPDLNSCATGAGTLLPNFAGIQNVPGSTPGVEGGFVAQITIQGATCLVRDIDPTTVLITNDEAYACMAQIAARCAAIGEPIPQ
jgi:hypothetical protein